MERRGEREALVVRVCVASHPAVAPSLMPASHREIHDRRTSKIKKTKFS